MRLPPLNSLRAFEAAARHCSVFKAAKELHVTPAAVSHQIKALEEHLGIELFKRQPRRLTLTPAAEACLPKLTAAFGLMADAVNSAQQLARAGRVMVSSPPALATKWLIPRLSKFRDLYPEIDLRIAARQTRRDFDRSTTGQVDNLLEDADIAFRLGDGDYPGYIVHKLFDTFTLPMCSPRLLQGEHPLRTPDDLRYHTLLHYESDNGSMDTNRPNWNSWLKAAGVRGIDTRRGPTFNHVTLAMQAAEDGLGVFLGMPALASTEMAEGRLVTPFPLKLPGGAGYYLLHNEESQRQPTIVAFRDWVLSEARQETWTADAETAAGDAEKNSPTTIASPRSPD